MEDQKNKTGILDDKTQKSTITEPEEKTEILFGNDAEVTQLLSDDLDDKTELPIEDEEHSLQFPNDYDEKTEVLSDVDDTLSQNHTDPSNDETAALINQIDHQEESSLDTNLSDAGDPPFNESSENLSQIGPFNDEAHHYSEEEPTEALMDEITIKTKKRKKLFIALGAVAGVCILTALAFFIPAQMKASEINKSLDLGEKYLEEGKYEEAILAFDDVIAIEPKQVVAYEGKGSANIGLKNYSEAETQLETAKSIDYTDNGKVLMSDVYINTERKDLGEALLDEVTNHNPEETRVTVYVSKLYSQLNEYNKVIELLEKKITNTTDKEELKKLYDELITTYVKSGKTEAEILALLERAAKATDDQSYLDKKTSYSVKKPSFSLAPGEYQGTQSLEMIKGNPTDKIYYTFDGSEPSAASTEYATPINLQPGEITVKMMEINEAGVKSPIQEGKYTIQQSKLTNEEFINKVYGVWYCVDNKNVVTMSNPTYSASPMGAMGRGGGDYRVTETTENGGTIIIVNNPKYYVQFDFGTPNDNRISILSYNDNTWYEYTVAEYMGNLQYRIPALGNIPSTTFSF